jgi:chromosome segregation protein
MKFTRLRLSGFKSFVEPTELLIENGLTGIVGPNGCGKSNLLEALRWVMGESSYKSMRAAGMDDVIFSGTSGRPSRNMAEVLVTLDNADRDAPPSFNDSDIIEVSRRIEREAGSAYRINGKDVRARDVQLMFADASTGARSPALMRQGQIAELISAKPQSRRLILEEAAGITGLHTRRHEAELKLRAAEQNLARLDDVVAQLESQLNSLRRQARQAQKYKQISAEIRKLEAAGLYVAWKEAAESARHDAELLDQATRQLAEHTRAASERLRVRDELGERLPALREQETVRAAVVQRLSIERNTLDDEQKRAEARKSEIESRLTQIGADLAREHEAIRDTDEVIARLTDEQASLSAAEENEGSLRAEAARTLQLAADSLARAQDAADAAAARLSELMARRNAILRNAEEQQKRIARLEQEAADLDARRLGLAAAAGDVADGPRLVQAVEATQAALAEAEAAANAAEVRVREGREREARLRQAHEEARRKAERLQTEISTLNKLLDTAGGGLWPPLVDAVKVAPGYEAALGAALGEDIEAPADEAAPIHWRGLPPLEARSSLPGEATPLTEFVTAPAALQRRLSHIGVVSRATGAALQSLLKPGQRLVSREGDVWRWDGFTAAADAPSASARRLEERNRLAGLEADLREALRLTDAERAAFDTGRQQLEEAVKNERELREAWRAANAAVDVARRALSQHERRMSEQSAQASALEEAARRVSQTLAELRQAASQAQSELQALPSTDGLAQELQGLRDKVNSERASYAECRARHEAIEREAKARGARLAAITREIEQWRERSGRTKTQIEALTARQQDARSALDQLASLPEQFAEKRRKLLSALQEAERERSAAADALQASENDVRSADQELRVAQDQLAGSREEHARLEARLESSRQRYEHCERRIAEALMCRPEEIIGHAELDPEKLPPQDDIERRLTGLREDRERLGGVNLRADEEAEQVAGQLGGLKKERDDLLQAIAKLRGGIGSLNREGRQRLLDAFGSVNEKFGELFSTLFGGGKAELQLIESEDPLEAGLEIVANPPGKKPTTLSLLSGGEQTLTALALIFAVFLTNPSPICVLDEVDAPLDDHNVERFCNLLDAMLERTETRFLVITHHPLTMARMHRLFGVTMMERGVSQLVSVSLEQAEALREAS